METDVLKEHCHPITAHEPLLMTSNSNTNEIDSLLKTLF